ncbi:MAG TPA: SOS response-associated peptidase family protein [Acidimicrobiia bacterium]|nr:SOS response-associated peptidase family protein [Acidimicrobiia bacterium]
MCGRAQFLKVPEIIEEYGPARVGDVVEGTPGEEAFPRSVVPGLVLHKGERVVSSFSWAFFDDGTGHNARLETAADRPAWREAYASARLVLPLARFAEGRAWFSDAAGRSLAVAGLYRLGAPPAGGPARRATMLTRPADAAVAPFHERMPVVLPPDLIGPWLAGEPVPVGHLLAESPILTAEPLARPGPPPPEQPSLL